MLSLLRKKRTLILLVLILAVGLFLRVYKLETFYSFGHDQDLSAWIAKDIIIDHHIRLIGQETSILGLFIGPLFYYFISFSFALFNMHPLSGAFITTVFGLFTSISIYWVFKKFFNEKTGLIGAAFYAITPGIVFLDRWVVPTQPTVLWSIWFLYVLLSILNSNFKILIPLGILIGLIWHIHIALLPLIALLPIAYFLSAKKNFKSIFNLKSIIISLIFVSVLVAPLLLFEIRHNFLQTKSLIASTQITADNLSGLDRAVKVFNSSIKSFVALLTFEGDVSYLNQLTIILSAFIICVVIIILYKNKLFKKNQIIILSSWYILVLLSQFFSKKSISEYYFNNLLILLLLTISLFLYFLDSMIKKTPFALFFLIFYAITSILILINKPNGNSGFSQKIKSIEFIKADSIKNNYSCIGINHIEPKENAVSGFRYLFWYYGLDVITPGNDVPVYSIVNPWTISGKEVNTRFGDIGIILPLVKSVDPKVCSDQKRQLLPLWGFNN